MFRFNKFAEDKISLQVTRRDMATALKRFWKLESTNFQLHPLEPTDPRQGGKVTVKSLVFDVRTFTFRMKTFYGLYGDDFIQYGEFKDGVNPLEDDERLLKLTEDISESDEILNKTTFKFENDELNFAHDVNENLVDPETEFSVEDNQLLFSSKVTWSETFFYGLGNKNM